MRYHDFHLSGYKVSEFGRKITLHLVWNYAGKAEPDSYIEFEGVACYRFSHTEGAILTDIDEESLDTVLKEEEEFLSAAAKQDGLRFWRSDFAQYIDRLKVEGYKAWRLDSAIGFSGFVVAKAVSQKEE